ncbi:HlyD family secretion protein [Frigidibacter sp. MR17.24]|uniref:HlyD family secretion protein n=1 Tax=Frigidibacter sp. MR17.24 TaxID=3127345 RepID=UPI003012B947
MADDAQNTPAAPSSATQKPAEKTAEKTGEKSAGTGRRKKILATVAVVALVGAAWWGYGYWTEGRFMVETDDAYVQSDITLISSRVEGYVAEAPVRANSHVTAGEVILRLDDGDYRIALGTAQSRFDTAGDTLARIDAQIDAARAAVAQAEASQDAAQAQLTNARTNAKRIRSLAATRVVSQAQLDTANETLDTAEAGLAEAKAAVTSAEAQVAVLAAQRKETEGNRRELQLAVDQAQRDLDKTVLRAPADGVIANIDLEPGDLVSPGTRLAALVPDGGLYVEANYKETQLPGVTVGAEVHLTFDALPDRDFTGHVTSLAPATGAVFSLLPAENATGNFTKVVQRVPVRISIPADAVATGHLRAGLSTVATVDSRTGSGRPVETAPAAKTPDGTPDRTPAETPTASRDAAETVALVPAPGVARN